jgi:hypothetical protein
LWIAGSVSPMGVKS